MAKSAISKISEFRCEKCTCYIYPGEDFSLRTPGGWLCLDCYIQRKEKCETNEYDPDLKLKCVNCGVGIDVVHDGHLREASGFLWCEPCESQRLAALKEK